MQCLSLDGPTTLFTVGKVYELSRPEGTGSAASWEFTCDRGYQRHIVFVTSGRFVIGGLADDVHYAQFGLPREGKS
jgi:hypothetical protein